MEANIKKLYYYRCQLESGGMGYRMNDAKMAGVSYDIPETPLEVTEDEATELADLLSKHNIALVLQTYRDDAGEPVQPDEELLGYEREEDY